MTQTPLVSVIIPTYNRKEMTVEAVRSVLDQTYPHLECLVLDGGSSDKTLETLRSAFKSSIRIYENIKGGVSAARNFGIRNSKGPLIAFLDSDDVWKKKKLEKQVAFLNQCREFTICQTMEIWMRQGRRVNPGEVHKKTGGAIFSQSLERCMVTPSSVLLRRSLLDEVGLFDEELPVCEDYDLWLRITARFPVGLLREDLLIRNGGRPDQLSSQHSLDKYRIKALGKLLNNGPLNSDQYDMAYQVFKKRCAIYGNGCLKRGRAREGRHYLALTDKARQSAWARVYEAEVKD
jgi:glycosyltransferase involved in cell wall biosynthesis